MFHETMFKTVVIVVLDHSFMIFGNCGPTTVFSNLQTVVERPRFWKKITLIHPLVTCDEQVSAQNLVNNSEDTIVTVATKASQLACPLLIHEKADPPWMNPEYKQLLE